MPKNLETIPERPAAGLWTQRERVFATCFDYRTSPPRCPRSWLVLIHEVSNANGGFVIESELKGMESKEVQLNLAGKVAVTGERQTSFTEIQVTEIILD